MEGDYLNAGNETGEGDLPVLFLVMPPVLSSGDLPGDHHGSREETPHRALISAERGSSARGFHRVGAHWVVAGSPQVGFKPLYRSS